MPRNLEDIDADLTAVQAKRTGAQIVWQDMGSIMDACRAEETRLAAERTAAEKGAETPVGPALADLIAKGEKNLKGKLEDVVAEATSVESEVG